MGGPPTVGRRRLTDRWAIVGGLSLAVVARVAIVAATHASYHPVSDAADFSRIAQSIVDGHGFGAPTIHGTTGPGAFRAPAWPALLAVAHLVAGSGFTAGRLLVAALGVALVGALALLAWQVAGRRVGLVTLYLAAVYPPLLLGGYGLNYEALMGLLVVLVLLCGLAWSRHPDRWRWLVAAGALSGAAILCRENAGVVLVPLWIMVLARRQTVRPRATVARLAAVVGCAAVVVAPWTIRNAVQLHAFVPVSDSAGLALASEYNAYSSAHLSQPDNFSFNFTHPPMGRSQSELQFTTANQNTALRYIRAHPSILPRVELWNAVHLFDLQGPVSATWIAAQIPWPHPFIEVSVVSFYVLAAAGLLGVVTRRGRAVPKAVLAFPVAWALGVIFTVSIDQYRYEIEPFVVLMAAAALVGGFERWRHLAPERATATG